MISDKEAELNIKEFLISKKDSVEKEIEKYIPRKATKEWVESGLDKTVFELDLEAYTAGCNAPIWDLLSRGGKRFRPILTCITSETVGGEWSDGLKVAPIVEIIHNGCIEEDSLVWMADGTSKKIQDVEVGEYVISVDKNGKIKERRVLSTHNNGKKKVFRVKTNNRTLATTEEHPFLVIRKYQPIRFKVKNETKIKLKEILLEKGETISSMIENVTKITDFGFTKKHLKNAVYGYASTLIPEEFADYLCEEFSFDLEKDFKKVQCKYADAGIEMKWIRAKNLKQKDVLVIGKDVYSDGEIPKIPKIKQSYKDKYSLPLFITKEFIQLCGMLIGDGSISGGKVSLCLPKGDLVRNNYANLIEGVFSVQPSKYPNCLTICSKAIEELFTHFGLNTNHNTIKIPNWIFKLSKENKLAFVKGYIDSDGHVNKKGQVCFDCNNKGLMAQMKMLIDSCGFVTSNLDKRNVSNEHFQNAIKKESTLFGFDIYSRNKLLKEIGTENLIYKQRLAQVSSRAVQFRYEEAVPSIPQTINFEKIGFNAIKEITIKENIQTYDIEVDQTHSYVANGIVVHNTLMQDDVEDDSAARRGQPCTHHKFGVDTAVNTGTIMYFWPMVKIMNDDFSLGEKKKMEIYDLFVKELLRVCSGQAWDIAWHHGGFTPNEKQYLNMCLSKTGVLTKFACQLGAIVGNADEKQYEALGKFGQIVGVGFQIQDDILELTEVKFKKGKGSIGGDIHEGKRTLIVIRTLEVAKEEDKKRLIQILDSHTEKEEEIKEALGIINKYDGIVYSKKVAEKMVEDAWGEVNSVLKESNAKKVLKKFAEYLVDRKI